MGRLYKIISNVLSRRMREVLLKLIDKYCENRKIYKKGMLNWVFFKKKKNFQALSQISFKEEYSHDSFTCYVIT